ncbi:MAG: ABC transporter permease [Candidatus Hydrothermia bacterium]
MIKTAFRNLLRHKRRTILTFSILSVGIIYYIVLQGMLDGFEFESIRNFIYLESGHLKITSINYNFETFEGSLSSYVELEKTLRSFQFIKGIAPRLKIVGALDNGVDDYPVIIVGIDPEKDKTVFKINEYVKGTQLTPYGIWIGSVIADKFNVKEGDYLYLTFKGKRGSIVSQEFEIQGIIDCPSFLNNNLLVYANLATIRNIGGFEDDVSEISLLIDDYQKSFLYKKTLEEKLNNVKISTWQEEGQDFLSISQAKKAAQYVLIFFIILIGIIGTTNTLLIAVFERVREIGTLKAIGMTDDEIMTLFVIEGVLIGIAGSLAGVILGVLINYYLVTHGTNWSLLLPKDMNWGYRVSGIIKNSWNITSIWVSLLLGPISTFIASLIPAKRAKKLTPAECLRWI